MKKNILSIAVVLIALFSFSTAFAQNLVVKQQPYAIDLGRDLRVCVDFAGLGNISSVDITVHFDAYVTTNCYNQGQDKKGTGPVPGLSRSFNDQSSTLTFDVRNGRTRGCQTLFTSYPAGDCPSGNMRSTTDVTFTNIWFEILGRTFYLDDPSPVAPSN